MSTVTNILTSAKDFSQQLKESSNAHLVRCHCRGPTRSLSLGNYFNRYEAVWRRFDLANLTRGTLVLVCVGREQDQTRSKPGRNGGQRQCQRRRRQMSTLSQ